MGSFLNVVILRFNTGISLGGRSKCFSCSKKLNWYELIPIFSFIFIKGRCFGCKTRISIQYPLVELLTGLLFLLTFLKYPNFIFSWIEILIFVLLISIWSVFMVLTVYDIHHKILPDKFVFIFIGLSILWLAYLQHTTTLDLKTILAGPILFLFFFCLWFFSQGRWMGFGDAKLALGIGIFLGFEKGITAIIIAFWAGALFSIVYISILKILKILGQSQLSLLKKPITMKSEIPFGPFLILATISVFFLDLNVFKFWNL